MNELIEAGDKCFLFSKNYCGIVKHPNDVYNLHFNFWTLYRDELGYSPGFVCTVSLEAKPSFVEFLTTYFNSSEGKQTLKSYSYLFGVPEDYLVTLDDAHSFFMNSQFAYEDCSAIASKYVELLKSINPSWIIYEDSPTVCCCD